MEKVKPIFRLKFDTDGKRFTCLVSNEVARQVLNSVGKRRVIRFISISGNWHAVIMDHVFHVEAGTTLQT